MPKATNPAVEVSVSATPELTPEQLAALTGNGEQRREPTMNDDLFWSIMRQAPTNVKVQTATPNGNTASYSTKSNMETADKVAKSRAAKMSLIVETYKNGGKVKATIEEPKA